MLCFKGLLTLRKIFCLRRVSITILAYELLMSPYSPPLSDASDSSAIFVSTFIVLEFHRRRNMRRALCRYFERRTVYTPTHSVCHLSFSPPASAFPVSVRVSTQVFKLALLRSPSFSEFFFLYLSHLVFRRLFLVFVFFSTFIVTPNSSFSSLCANLSFALSPPQPLPLTPPIERLLF